MFLLHRKKIDIYANISLFLSYSEVTICSSDGHCSHQIQSVSRSDDGSASRDNLYSSYSPERQRSLEHVDEPQRQIPSEDPIT